MIFYIFKKNSGNHCHTAKLLVNSFVKKKIFFFPSMYHSNEQNSSCGQIVQQQFGHDPVICNKKFPFEFPQNIKNNFFLYYIS